MSHENTYRLKARSVRREAQDHLRQLREERLAARRRSGAAPAAAAPPPASGPQFASLRRRAVISDAGPDGPEQAAPDPVPDIPADTVPSITQDVARSAPDAGPSSEAGAQGPDDGPDDGPEDVTGTTPDAPEEKAEAAPAALPPEPHISAEDVKLLDIQTSDLNTLPGAGVGLVWLLHECGVTTMADLAVADAQDLSDQLGIVGQLIDLDVWIEEARGV